MTTGQRHYGQSIRSDNFYCETCAKVRRPDKITGLDLMGHLDPKFGTPKVVEVKWDIVPEDESATETIVKDKIMGQESKSLISSLRVLEQELQFKKGKIVSLLVPLTSLIEALENEEVVYLDYLMELERNVS